MGDNLSIPERLEQLRRPEQNDRDIITFEEQMTTMILNDFMTPFTISFINSIKSNSNRVKLMIPSLKKAGLISLKFIETQKNDDMSIKFRNMGNVEYRSRNLMNALELYNKSLAYANCNSANIGLAYGNRSAILFELKQYTECLEDIDRAKNNNFPQSSLKKLLVRHEKCMILLTASDSVLLAVRALNELQYLMQMTNIKTSLEKNNEIPCASNSVKITFTEEYGRHIIATKDIRAGEIIAAEKPYSLSLLDSNRYTRCHNCFNKSLTLLTCAKCPYVMYCSTNCRETAWKTSHKIECSILATLFHANYDKFHQGLMISLKAIENLNFEELKVIVKEVESQPRHRTSGFTKDKSGKMIYDSNNYATVHALVPDLSEQLASVVFEDTVAASTLIHLLRDHTSLRKILQDTSNFEILGGLILHNILCTLNYSHGVEEFPVRSNNVLKVGLSILPFHNLFNHSCCPNISRGFYYSTGEVHCVSLAILPIKKGQPLWDCYKFSYAKRPKIVRQEMLLTHFNFKCSCVACKNDFPLEENLPAIPGIPENVFDIRRLKPGPIYNLLPKVVQELNLLANKKPFPNRNIVKLQELVVVLHNLKGYRDILIDI